MSPLGEKFSAHRLSMCVASQTRACDTRKVGFLANAYGHPKMQLKIFIVEHFPVVRAGIRHWLTPLPDMEIVGEAASAEEGIRLIRTIRPDIVLLDIATPDKNGYEILLAFKSEQRTLPILLINSRPEQFYALELMNNGASGYFPSHGTADELVQAIRTVCSGERYSGKTPLPVESNDGQRALHECLNPREYEIFHSICRGERPATTARKLSLSLSTVNRYRKQVFSKMGVEGVPGLIRYAIHQGIDVQD